MKTVSFSLLALLATLPLTGVAHAQNFDGPSVGFQAGWVENKVRNTETDLGSIAIDKTKDSAVIGGFVGYDKEIGNFVIGGEAGLSFGTSDTLSSGGGSNQVLLNPKRSFDLSARAGYLVTPKTLVYGRGGYANERLNVTTIPSTGTEGESEDRDGWLVGGGVERKVTDKLSARVEYRYSDLSEGDGLYDRHQVLTGVTFRF